MAKKKPSGGTPALVALDAAGVTHTVHRYEHDPASGLGYGLEAATTGTSRCTSPTGFPSCIR